MNEKMIRKLIKLVEDSRIDQLEVSSWGRKVRITRRINANNGHFDQAMAVQAVAAPSPAPAAPIPEAPVSKVDSAAVDADKKYVEVKSPMVGTFYAAPAPDAQPYVTLNQRIEVGQVVCIVEAMKLMNEIESDVAGTIVRVCVENAQPVEYGQVLFLVQPD